MSFGGKGKNRGGKTINGSNSTETINGYAVSYYKKTVKCNKENCGTCSEKGGGHGPYWYKKYRTKDGKARSKYVGKVKPDQAQEKDDETE
jgi:hypothetical protein